jgi:hypothetical protein
MRYDGANLDEVIAAHYRWLQEEDGDEVDRADFSDMSLAGLRLSGCNFYGAIMKNVDFAYADLRAANLSRAVLTGATNLSKAILNDSTDLRGAIDIPFVPIACPDTGYFTAWKAARKADDSDYVILKLLIPADANRTSATGRACRASGAMTLEIQTLDRTVLLDDRAVSIRDKAFAYVVGETARVANFEQDRWRSSVPGIHFFINRQDAVEYATSYEKVKTILDDIRNEERSDMP